MLAVEVRQCLLTSLAVEVRQCPLRSGARGWGPAMPTEIWSSQLRRRRWRKAESGGRRDAPPIDKSRDPHLAGGEQRYIDRYWMILTDLYQNVATKRWFPGWSNQFWWVQMTAPEGQNRCCQSYVKLSFSWPTQSTSLPLGLVGNIQWVLDTNGFLQMC